MVKKKRDLRSLIKEHSFLFKAGLFGTALFLTYSAVRNLKINENMLKLFLIPAILNIILVILQAFDSNIVSFIPVSGVGGFLGNRGLTACFLAITTPLFIKYCKLGLPFLFLALLLCQTFTAILACVCVVMFYFWYSKRKQLEWWLVACGLILALVGLFHKNNNMFGFEVRHKTYMETINMIGRNPILGWGVGSYLPIMTDVALKNMEPEQDNKISSIRRGVMHHPHNEMLLGWFSFGILFPIVVLIYAVDIVRRFNRDKIVPFTIMIAGVICSMGYFLSPPAWFLMMFGLGVYDNKEVKHGTV